MTPNGTNTRLVENLLSEQSTLTSVERFAQVHRDAEEPLLAPHYRELIPIGRNPGPGEHLAFRVDLDACTGCKACVTACHSLNGLRPEETWRDVGLMLDVGQASTSPQTVTTACHHCEEPACLLGCPTRAYEKDPQTGIVQHLDDQCIGCQYCLLTCPYDAPRFDASLGIVRKCDMCADRLRVGEAPACVQGCPTSAISIDIVRTAMETSPLLPGLGALQPSSSLTRPTTKYVTVRDAVQSAPAGAARVSPNHGHPALVCLLVLVQLSTGTLAVGLLANLVSPPALVERTVLLLVAGLAAAVGLAASIAHLGRPTQAFRAVLGWRTSWMSREILALGAYAGLLVAAAAAALLGVEGTGTEHLALLAGIAGCACSVQVYATTGRAWWRTGRTATGFASTALILGGASVTFIGIAAGAASDLRITAAVCVAILFAVASLVRLVRMTASRSLDGDLQRSLVLLRGPLRRAARARTAATTLGITGLIAVAPLHGDGFGPGATTAAGAALLSLLVGELIERHLFFTAEAARAMPGL